MEMIVTIVCSSITMFPVSGWNLKVRMLPYLSNYSDGDWCCMAW